MSSTLIEIIGEKLNLKKLNLKDSLSDIRNNGNFIDDTLIFLKKTNNEYAEIERKEEKTYRLEEIITVKDNQNILYLMRKPDWNIFNDKYKLDYGRTMSFDGTKKANKRAFKMNDCELTKISDNGFKRDYLEFESKKDWMEKTNLFFSSDVNVKHFAELGFSVESSHIENLNNEIKSSYEYIEFGKIILKFSEHLTPTEEFINAVKYANLDDPEEYRKITEEYGHFIPSEVVLGGRAYFKDIKVSSEISSNGNVGNTLNIGALSSKFKVGHKYSNSEDKSKFYSFNHMRLLGGSHPEGEKFDEKAWIESLIDHKNWDCIEFRDPINIFQLLPEDLRKKNPEKGGKKILYTCIKECDYYLNEPGRYRDFELKLPRKILDVILNKKADCDIFATVIDTKNSKNVFITCQILKPKVLGEEKLGKPRIIIHGVQKNFQPRKLKLKIKIMVVGIDLDFMFNPTVDTKVQMVENTYDPQNEQNYCDLYSMKFNSESDLISGNIPFFGIPILRNFNISNDSLVIGHKFCKTQLDKEYEIRTFSYCLKKNQYVNLPEFTFHTLIILNDTAPNAYELLSFKFNKLKKPFIDLKEESTNPKYTSLYLSSNENNYKPLFLKQKFKKIKIEYVDCKCDKTCSFCKNKTFKLSNKVECIVYDYKNHDDKVLCR
ncbi:hypothetical protein RclHR1_04300014 [Rhizophagus clarus]|uniref:DUF7431 domain-containing protein n=1 Tax=Rhizophagus clarus TaxID=94130 RepID=A0A2Z6RZ01_9GLOM|nr:hypothetical protein RclHR1_04300014 [Rhizophagus clarus]GES72708.1 hypothetical protein GLOIN_2v1473651 [Rhizophagus clarus]